MNLRQLCILMQVIGVVSSSSCIHNLYKINNEPALPADYTELARLNILGCKYIITLPFKMTFNIFMAYQPITD